MAYARQVTRRSRAELALLRAHESEAEFGVQIAASTAQDALGAGRIAVERGAKFVDINAGCPIHDTIKRGMGATLLKRVNTMVDMVELMTGDLGVPVTVKIRSGWTEKETTAVETALRMQEAGAAAITLHPRSREQRYTKSADWSLVAATVEACSIPVIGNGDILTWYEARDRQQLSGCASVMLARGALVKPWLFQEMREQRDWQPTAEERLAVYYRLACYMKEHFRDDDTGRTRAMRFLPWHFGFFCRYRPLPVEQFEARAKEHPLLQSRALDDPDASPLERLLRDVRVEVHAKIADLLWDAAGLDAAKEAAEELAVSTPEPAADERAAREFGTSHG